MIMTPSKPIRVVVSDPIREAIDAYCAQHEIEMSTLARTALLREIGRLDLLETMAPEGRPKVEKPAPKPRKKRKPRGD